MIVRLLRIFVQMAMFWVGETISDFRDHPGTWIVRERWRGDDGFQYCLAERL